jgi:hypothetical protein
MPKPKGKLAVEPVKRRDWYYRYEELGESVTVIAEAVGYDPRTVKKAIDEERDERERREAKSKVLREAMGQHYQDICKVAEGLDEIVTGSRAGVDQLRDTPMGRALKEHLPRVGLWRDLDRWERLRHELVRVDGLIQARAERVTRGLSDKPGVEFGPGLLEAVSHHSKSLAWGEDGLDVDGRFKTEPAGEGRIRMEVWPFLVGVATPEQVEDGRALLRKLFSEVAAWEEHHEQAALAQKFRCLAAQVHDGILQITLKRVVGGRCRYCP